MPIRLIFRQLSLGAAVLLPACHDGTVAPTPVVSFDATKVLARVDPLAAVFDQPIFASFDASLSFFEGAFRSTGGAAPISDSARGRTFVYDAVSRAYIVDPSAVGAPANGVRYVLYEWRPGAGAPSSPLTRIGYTDIAPMTDAQGQATEIVLFRDHPFLVPADFIVRHSVANGTNVFSVAGSATDGITSDDEISVNGTESGPDLQHSLVYNASIVSTSLNVRWAEQLASDQVTGRQSGTLDLRYDGHVFSDQSTQSGFDLTVDGSLYARILSPVDGDATRYVRSDGTPLPTPEVAALNALLNRVVSATFFWIGLAYP